MPDYSHFLFGHAITFWSLVLPCLLGPARLLPNSDGDFVNTTSVRSWSSDLSLSTADGHQRRRPGPGVGSSSTSAKVPRWLPLPVSHCHLCPEQLEIHSFLQHLWAWLSTPLGPLFTGSHNLKSLGCCSLPWGPPPITKAAPETDALLWRLPE